MGVVLLWGKQDHLYYVQLWVHLRWRERVELLHLLRVTFWKSIPGMVKDGFRYAAAKARGDANYG
eukprot:gene4106-1282_t